MTRPTNLVWLWQQDIVVASCAIRIPRLRVPVSMRLPRSISCVPPSSNTPGTPSAQYTSPPSRPASPPLSHKYTHTRFLARHACTLSDVLLLHSVSHVGTTRYVNKISVVLAHQQLLLWYADNCCAAMGQRSRAVSSASTRWRGGRAAAGINVL